MKKLLAVLLALFMCLTFFLCFTLFARGKSSPEDPVKVFSDAMKKYDLETMMSCCKEAKAEDFTIDAEEEDELVKSIESNFINNAAKITYSVIDSSVDGDKGTVNVKYSFIDDSKEATEALGEWFLQVLSMAFSGASEEEMTEKFTQIFNDKIQNAEEKFVESTVTFNCSLVEKKWVIDEVPEGIANVMSCNIMNAFSGISEDFDNMITVDDSGQDTQAAQPAFPAENPEVKNSPVLEYNGVKAEIVKAYPLTVESGEPTAVVVINFTNNGSTGMSFLDCSNMTVYQNGVEAERSFFYNQDFDVDSYMKKVKDGGTIQVCQSYTLQNIEDPINIELTLYGENMFFNQAKTSYTINLSNTNNQAAPLAAGDAQKVEAIRIYNYTNDITAERAWPMLSLSRDGGNEQVKRYEMNITAQVIPMDIQNPVITWTVSDPDVLHIEPMADNPNGLVAWQVGTKAGGVQLTAECNGVTQTITIYCVD